MNDDLLRPIEPTISGLPPDGVLAALFVANEGYRVLVNDDRRATVLDYQHAVGRLLMPQIPNRAVGSTSTNPLEARKNVTFPPEALEFAEDRDAKAAVDALCVLALQMVPSAEHVTVKVVCDPEDGSRSLRVTVRTSADVNTVVDAEDDLYDALFERVAEPAIRRLLALSYDFRG